MPVDVIEIEIAGEGDQRIPREEKSPLGVSWESLYHGEGRDDNRGGGRETEKPEGGRKVGDGDGREHFSRIYFPLAESHTHIAAAAVGLALTRISIHLHVLNLFLSRDLCLVFLTLRR